MSRRNDRIALQQMLDHAHEAIELNSKSDMMDRGSDRIRALAIVRLLEIIGESANRISEETRERHSTIPWRAIIDLRNRLIHGYDSVDMTIVGRIVTDDLPLLVFQLEEALSRELGET